MKKKLKKRLDTLRKRYKRITNTNILINKYITLYPAFIDLDNSTDI